jgi:hypothetical protein
MEIYNVYIDKFWGGCIVCWWDVFFAVIHSDVDGGINVIEGDILIGDVLYYS